jgi:hypothetical protein
MHVHYTAHGKNGARRADCRRLHLHRLQSAHRALRTPSCKVPPSWLEKGRTCGCLGPSAKGRLVRSVSYHMHV